MKKVLLILLVFNCRLIYGSFNFPDSSAIWTISSFGWGNCSGTQSFSITKDTIIDNSKYKVIKVTNDSIFNLKSSDYFCSIKDSANKWYFIFNGQSKRLLLYDFNLKTGDSITVDNFFGMSYKIKVISVDSIIIDGQKRKRLNVGMFQNQDNYVWESWIEGIGSTHGLFYSSFYIMDAGFSLMCFSQNSKLIYCPFGRCGCIRTALIQDTYWKTNIYPNPFKDKVTISNTHKDENIMIYNNQGQLIFQKVIVKDLDAVTIDLSKYPNGLYLLYLHGNDKDSQIIIKHK